MAISVFSTVTSCAPRAVAPHAQASAAWFSILIDDTSDWQIRLRPRDAVADPVFGPLLRRAEREASAAIGTARFGETTLQAIEQSEVIVLAVRTAKPLDAVIVVGGVSASVSPESMVDETGNPLWKRVDSRVRGLDEYARVGSGSLEEPMMRLVVLPARTWIVATGGAVDRLVSALSIAPPAPYRPEVQGAGRDLFDLLVVGELLGPLKNARNADMLEPLLAPLTRAALRVDGGKKPAAHLTLTYADESGAVHAEDFVRAMQTIFSARYPQLKALIESAAVSRGGRDVAIDAKIPSGLVRVLLEADRPRRYQPEGAPPTPTPSTPTTPTTKSATTL